MCLSFIYFTINLNFQEYKKPLEEASPAIISSSKIQTLFHRVPEILQCHKLFRIALTDAVANWDREHRIGDVFVASFSKAVVLDIYSDFINNFSVAMDLARSETKKKPALAEFFKVSIIWTMRLSVTELDTCMLFHLIPIFLFLFTKNLKI